MSTQDFISNGHAKNRIRYHFVFSTKYRRNSLKGIENTVYASFREAETKSDFTIIEMGIEDGNHIHLVVKTRPSLSPEQIVRRMKQLTTHSLWKQEEQHFKKFYWKKKIIWSSGYFVSTIGAVSDKIVIDYVKKQAK